MFIEVGAILHTANSWEQDYMCSPHQRCGAHTINFGAVQDSKAAREDALNKKIGRRAMGKCARLWNEASRSAVTAEVEYKAVQFALIVSNAPRRNFFKSCNR